MARGSMDGYEKKQEAIKLKEKEKEEERLMKQKLREAKFEEKKIKRQMMKEETARELEQLKTKRIQELLVRDMKLKI